MFDFLVKLFLGVLGCIAIALVCVMVLVTIEMSVNADKYECKKTGRQIHSFIMAGKVMVPTVTDETICTLKEPKQ